MVLFSLSPLIRLFSFSFFFFPPQKNCAFDFGENVTQLLRLSNEVWYAGPTGRPQQHRNVVFKDNLAIHWRSAGGGGRKMSPII